MTPRRFFWRGFRDSAPFLVVLIPYGMIFGAVARDAGFDILQVMSMSVLVIAGASQFTAIALLKDHAPTIVVLLAALLVNLRMALYSAAMVPHFSSASRGMKAALAYLLVDHVFAVSSRKFEETPEMTQDEKIGYYLGCISLVGPLWYATTLTGALIGNTIPASLSLDFAVPVCFIALTAPLIRSLPHAVAAAVSVVSVVALSWLPWSIGIVGAALLAMLAGARTEALMTRRTSGTPV